MTTEPPPQLGRCPARRVREPQERAHRPRHRLRRVRVAIPAVLDHERSDVSLLANPIGILVGVWILALTIAGDHPLDRPLEILAAVNIVGAYIILAHNWINAWEVSKLVLPSRRDRLRLALRLNPLFVIFYWIFWSVSIVIGIQMFIRDMGLVWERTEKVDANHDLVRDNEPADIGRAGIRVLERDVSVNRRYDQSSTGPSASRPGATVRPTPGRPLQPAARAYLSSVDGARQPSLVGGRNQQMQDDIEIEDDPTLMLRQGPSYAPGGHRSGQHRAELSRVSTMNQVSGRTPQGSTDDMDTIRLRYR
jgi:hypothetical protein